MTTILPLSPFITDPDNRFVLDEEAFMAEIEGLPAFLSAPRPEYLKGEEMAPFLRVLASHMRRYRPEDDAA